MIGTVEAETVLWGGTGPLLGGPFVVIGGAGGARPFEWGRVTLALSIEWALVPTSSFICVSAFDCSLGIGPQFCASRDRLSSIGVKML